MQRKIPVWINKHYERFFKKNYSLDYVEGFERAVANKLNKGISFPFSKIFENSSYRFENIQSFYFYGRESFPCNLKLDGQLFLTFLITYLTIFTNYSLMIFIPSFSQ